MIKTTVTKKKLTSLLIVLTLLMGMSSQVFALEYSASSEMPQRVSIYDAIDTTSTPEPRTRATTAPTSYAPTSWYNTKHTWTATYYTYSSYYFNTSSYPYLDISANSSYKVEFYKTNGTYWGSITPSYDSSKGSYYGSYYFNPGEDYYMIIYNLGSSSISSGAWYLVGNVF